MSGRSGIAVKGLTLAPRDAMSSAAGFAQGIKP